MTHDPRTAIFPGSFDPITNGHVDVVHRATRLFDQVIVAVLTNTSKQPYFSVEDRVAMLCEVFKGQNAIEVDTFNGLLVDYARARKANVILRGVRDLTDFEAERQMALMNHRLNADIDTVFMTPSENCSFISSRLVREIAALGGSLSSLVPPVVADRLVARRRKTTLRSV
jgi:pantetheine-phosphate adenylyltransferase